MHCKYSREASEMYCILSGKYKIDLCWNIDDLMKKCSYFSEVSKDQLRLIRDIPDVEFIKNENI